MDISSNHNSSNIDRGNLERNRAVIRAFQHRLGSHREQVSTENAGRGEDRVDVSRRGAVLSDVFERLENAGMELERADVQKLKRAYQSGHLNTPEQIGKAAMRLLGQEA